LTAIDQVLNAREVFASRKTIHAMFRDALA